MIPDGLIEAASFNPTSLRSPNSWIGHLPFAAWVMQQVSPKIFVELGTHSGNSYFAFCQSVAEARLSTRCYAVDTWQGDEHAGQYGEEIFASVHAHNQANYSAFSRLLRMTFDDAASYFSDESIGLLHIDGLHTYEAVRHDFATWLPKLAPGAVVMFHDTNVRERNFGVWKLWEELQAHYPNNLEFVHSHGLGVLQLNNAPEEKKLAWLQPDYPGKETLKSYFAALGARQLERFDFNELKQYADSLKKALAERDGELAMLKNAVTEYVARINRFEELAEGLTATIHQYETSRSWRLTKPLRWLTAMSHGGGVLLRRAHVKTKTEGFSSALARVAQIYRNEGLLNAVFKRANVRLIGSTKSKDLIPFRNSGYTYIEPAAPSDLNEQLERMAIKPMFSIVVPVYNTPPSLLTAAIESVKKQWYPHWELILVNDASPARETCAALAKINDNRIKVLHLQENTGISGATNAGLDAAGGDYIVFMDHDDEITPDCLYELALCINREDPDFIYSDEDKLTETGEFTEPHFKPDWSPQGGAAG